VRLQIENRSVNVKLTSNTATINASTTVAAALTSHQRSLEQEHYYQVIFFDEARLAARDAFLLSQHSRSPSITREKTQFAREIHPREKPTVTHEKHNHTWKTARFLTHVENRKRTRENNAHPNLKLVWGKPKVASRIASCYPKLPVLPLAGQQQIQIRAHNRKSDPNRCNIPWVGVP